MNVEDGFQIKDLWLIVRRRVAVAGIAGGGIFLAAILLAGWLPNRYSASSTILVEPQAISEFLIQSGLQESNLNKRLNIMTAQILSRPRLSRIIDQYDLYQDESDYLLRETIIETMRSRVSVKPVEPDLGRAARSVNNEINEFKIVFEHRNPVIARVSASVRRRPKLTSRVRFDYGAGF